MNSTATTRSANVARLIIQSLKQQRAARLGRRRVCSQIAHSTGFTLIELLLSLSLIVVTTALIGSLMSLYARSFTSKSDQIKQKQLARSLLTMMADDIRAVVLTQPYDAAVLEQMLSGAVAGGTGVGSSNDTDAGATGGSAATIGSSDNALDTNTDYTTATGLMPGIYGTSNQLMVDVSRLPRTFEYTANNSQNIGVLADLPGDLKTVTYWVQGATALGVQDSMAQITSSTDGVINNSGLVRRALDRAVTRQAESTAQSTPLMTQGELVAPEVVSIEFSYFDGSQWLTQWDSSQQGLPWLIQITLALQQTTAAATNPIGGVSLSALTVNDLESNGIDLYHLTVAIPGAQLQPLPTAQTSSSSGMGAVGL